MPFMVRSAALFIIEIISGAGIRQGLLFRRYKRKLTRSVNVENAVTVKTDRKGPIPLKEKTIISFRLVNSNPKPE